MYAMFYCFLPRLLIGVDVNHQNNAGETALHAAAFRANNMALQYLINEGSDLMKKTLYVPLSGL